MLYLTFSAELVFSPCGSLDLEAVVTLIALIPDARMVEDADTVELTTTVDTLHHSTCRWKKK